MLFGEKKKKSAELMTLNIKSVNQTQKYLNVIES